MPAASRKTGCCGLSPAWTAPLFRAPRGSLAGGFEVGFRPCTTGCGESRWWTRKFANQPGDVKSAWRALTAPRRSHSPTRKWDCCRRRSTTTGSIPVRFGAVTDFRWHPGISWALKSRSLRAPIGRGEQRARGAALGDAEKGWPLRPDGVEHRAHVLHPLLEGRDARYGVRETSARLSNTISRANDV